MKGTAPLTRTGDFAGFTRSGEAASTAAEATRAHGDLDRTQAKQLAEAEARIAQARRDATPGVHQAAAEVATAATERLIGVKPDDKAAATAVSQAAGG